MLVAMCDGQATVIILWAPVVWPTIAFLVCLRAWDYRCVCCWHYHNWDILACLKKCSESAEAFNWHNTNALCLLWMSAFASYATSTKKILKSSCFWVLTWKCFSSSTLSCCLRQKADFDSVCILLVSRGSKIHSPLELIPQRVSGLKQCWRHPEPSEGRGSWASKRNRAHFHLPLGWGWKQDRGQCAVPELEESTQAALEAEAKNRDLLAVWQPLTFSLFAGKKKLVGFCCHLSACLSPIFSLTTTGNTCKRKISN